MPCWKYVEEIYEGGAKPFGVWRWIVKWLNDKFYFQNRSFFIWLSGKYTYLWQKSRPTIFILYLNYKVRKYITFFIICGECILNTILRRFPEHSVFSSSVSRSTMISSTFFSLLLALAAKECFAGMIIKTSIKLDETSIHKAAVSTLLFNFNSIMYISFVSKHLDRIVYRYPNSSKNCKHFT